MHYSPDVNAVHAGHPARLAFGVDSEGNVCGQQNGATGPDFTSRKFLYYLNPLALLQTSALEGAKAICVSQCPGSDAYCSSDNLPCHNGTDFMWDPHALALMWPDTAILLLHKRSTVELSTGRAKLPAIQLTCQCMTRSEHAGAPIMAQPTQAFSAT